MVNSMARILGSMMQITADRAVTGLSLRWEVPFAGRSPSLGGPLRFGPLRSTPGSRIVTTIHVVSSDRRDPVTARMSRLVAAGDTTAATTATTGTGR
jgi:hypothetical protein